jgi:protein TonB
MCFVAFILLIHYDLRLSSEKLNILLMKGYNEIEDLVFEHRNKSYGAYDLRKHYHIRMTKAIITGILVCLMLIVWSWYLFRNEDMDYYTYQELEIPVEVFKMPKLESAKSKSQVKEQEEAPVEEAKPDEIPTKVVEEEKITRPIDNIDEVQSKTYKTMAENSTSNAEGNASTTSGNDAEGSSSSPSDGVAKVPEVMPQFPGGNAALHKFLKDHIQYPLMARNMSIKGKVIVQFIVMEDGSISQIKVLNQLGGGCDEEAIRVVKMMPNWIPGLIKGKAIKVRFSLPISFNFQS